MANDAIDRIESRISPEPNSGCWLWMAGCDDRGYARISVGGRWRYAHRVYFEHINGPVQPGLELDHKCRMPCCVNPDHLEPVTHQENVRRGGAAGSVGKANSFKTHCGNGHPYDEANTYSTPEGGRQCRTCRRDYMRDYFQSRKRQQACT